MNSFNSAEFIQKTLEHKLQNLQEIHFFVLKCIYQNAKTLGCITENNTFSENISQCFSPTDMLKELGITGFTITYLLMCLNDLEILGLICNVQSNPCGEWAFGLTELGLQAIISHMK